MTISDTEARSLEPVVSVPGPVVSAPVIPREVAKKVLDYLVFHRSLIGEEDGSNRLLDRYLSLVEDLEEGVHVVITDPFHKATAMLFELVLAESFDPWEIDLVRFTQSYLERVREDSSFDFPVAGRLLSMAWGILYLQSEEVLRQRELPPEGDPSSEGTDPIDPSSETYLDLLQTPESVDVTSTILDGSTPSPLLEMVRHPEIRPVSLLELVRAFDEAETGARASARIQELRERLREEQRAPPEVLVHGDIPEQDVQAVWAGVLKHAKDEPFPFLDLWKESSGRSRLVALFLASLYLAREQSIHLEQERIPDTPLYLVRKVEARHPVMEEEAR